MFYHAKEEERVENIMEIKFVKSIIIQYIPFFIFFHLSSVELVLHEEVETQQKERALNIWEKDLNALKATDKNNLLVICEHISTYIDTTLSWGEEHFKKYVKALYHETYNNIYDLFRYTDLRNVRILINLMVKYFIIYPEDKISFSQFRIQLQQLKEELDEIKNYLNPEKRKKSS